MEGLCPSSGDINRLMIKMIALFIPNYLIPKHFGFKLNYLNTRQAILISSLQWQVCVFNVLNKIKSVALMDIL
jgi:hypothetical protein